MVKWCRVNKTVYKAAYPPKSCIREKISNILQLFFLTVAYSVIFLEKNIEINPSLFIINPVKTFLFYSPTYLNISHGCHSHLWYIFPPHHFNCSGQSLYPCGVMRSIQLSFLLSVHCHFKLKSDIVSTMKMYVSHWEAITA